MAYFHIDATQAYLRSLGFTNLVDRPLLARARANDEDNSYFDPQAFEVGFGTGGTDDAEDPDVVVHEYGHAIQESQVRDFGDSREGGAMGEGFGDYLAAVMAASHGSAEPFVPCIAEWDTLGLGDPAPIPCLRRADRDVTVAQVGAGTSCNARIHRMGEVWSGTLWDIRARPAARPPTAS